jgi:hypothetical protein
MTIRCAIINTDTKLVVNVIEYGTVPVGVPPGMDGNFIALADSVCLPGWGWNGTATFDQNPVVAVPAPQSVLPQDLMTQFTAADAALIQAAIATNAQFWLLWSAMVAQRDPMLVTNARFLAGWSALVQVLGQPRMAEIATALGVTVA